MKARSVVIGLMAAGVLIGVGASSASANLDWCMDDPPIQVITPGGHTLTVNNTVYLPASAWQMRNQVYDEATTAPDGHGGTLITVRVHVPSSSGQVVSNQYRYKVTDQGNGSYVITTYLDVPVS